MEWELRTAKKKDSACVNDWTTHMNCNYNKIVGRFYHFGENKISLFFSANFFYKNSSAGRIFSMYGLQFLVVEKQHNNYVLWYIGNQFQFSIRREDFCEADRVGFPFILAIGNYLD